MRRNMTAVMLVCCLFITGCWNRVEMNELNFVIGAGIDVKDDEVQLIAQVARPDVLAADAPQEKAYRTFTGTGKTIFDAIRDVTLRSPRKLFWGHHQVLLVSEKMAEEGLLETLAFFARDHETSRHVHIAIGEGEFKKLFTEHVYERSIPMMFLVPLMEGYKANAKTFAIKLHEFLKINSTPGMCVSLPIVRLRQENGFNMYEMHGTALFNENKMVGKLTPEETRGLLWLRDEVESAIIPMNITETAKEKDPLVQEVSFEVLSAKTKITADGELKFTVKSEVDVSFGEDNFREEVPRSEERKIIKKMTDKAKKIIESDMKQYVERSKEFTTDPAGFGRAMYRQKPNEWRKYEAIWCEKMYPQIEVTYDITVKKSGNMMLRDLDAQ
ncbi:hypothetical protein BHU72_00440 [Desulfuribacillus stibiiarsenatis]|uniref:Uncharacterized protein n=1 Tax=Desulfuribacillus stibiiarsenatis TaxID=1390249 RepID=A0A1E5L9H7_9FIRM|nr:Ger(x)C family spore germination protein [Desulfuribacillus stibiiarsenatis]OEH86776.1 hypothetical protein BHU72_00440 [Desulfuribacillus stibiiarsenatis]